MVNEQEQIQVKLTGFEGSFGFSPTLNLHHKTFFRQTKLSKAAAAASFWVSHSFSPSSPSSHSSQQHSFILFSSSAATLYEGVWCWNILKQNELVAEWLVAMSLPCLQGYMKTLDDVTAIYHCTFYWSNIFVNLTASRYVL